MASLATARTRLGLSGTPAPPEGSYLPRVTPTDFAVSDTLTVSISDSTPTISAEDSRTGYTATFTGLALSATPQRASGSFTKELVTLQNFDVVDSIFVTLTEDPVDQNEIIAADDVRVSLTDTANLRNNQAVTDTLSVSAVETIALQQTGVSLLTVTDTLSVTITDATPAVAVTLDVTDTLSVEWTEDPATVDTPLEILAVTDTLSVSATDTAELGIFAGVVPITAFDTLLISAVDAAAYSVTQPVGAITFRITQPQIRFEFL